MRRYGLQALFKPGQTCRCRNKWATVGYFVAPDQIIITYDDDTQELVDAAQVTMPDPAYLPRVYNVKGR